MYAGLIRQIYFGLGSVEVIEISQDYKELESNICIPDYHVFMDTATVYSFFSYFYQVVYARI